MLLSQRIAVAKTALPPCCLRVHPDDRSIVVVGTYQLEKETGIRRGSVDVYRSDEGLRLLQSYATKSAVLDVKFCPNDASILATAHSTGNVVLWRYLDGKLSQIDDHQVFDESALVTSIFFDPGQSKRLLATLTTGELALVNIDHFSVLVLPTSHDLECWTGSFGEIGSLQNVVYTGGDDGKLIAHDMRSDSSIWQTSYRHHDAGVVSILLSGETWNRSNPHHLWTGLYDDHLRVFDLRVVDKSSPALMPGCAPWELRKENLGGGVWRLIPSGLDNRVLVCCMYDGARIVDAKDDDFEVTRYFKKDHQSMCYGGDWASDASYVATCSFYDNVLQTWSPEAVEEAA